MSVEKLTDKLLEIAAALQGPGLDAAKGAASVEAMSTLASGLVCACVAAVAAYAACFAWRRLKTIDGSVLSNWEKQFGFTLLLVFSAFLSAVTGGRALWAFVDPWTWITIFQPELWLAKRALGL